MSTEVTNPVHGGIKQQSFSGKDGLKFDVSNLSYSIIDQGYNRTLLRNINFHLEPVC